MKLKTLVERQLIQLESTIFQHHKALQITSDEMMVLFALIDISKKRNAFTMQSISKRVSLVQQDLGMVIDKLIEKSYVFTYIDESTQTKAKELFHLDGLYSKLETILNAQEEQKSKASDDQLKTIIQLLESYLKRLLTSKELQDLRYFMDTQHVSSDVIIDSIHQLKDRASVKNIEKMVILSKNIPKVVVDEKIDKALDHLYKAIK
jgi:DNA replication protein DnaD